MGYYSKNADDIAYKSYYDRMGRGASLEPAFDNYGYVYINNGPERIKESIKDILSTPYGTRWFLPEYGTRLQEALFEPNDFIAQDLVKDEIKEALGSWEPRIEVLDVAAESSLEEMTVSVTYLIKSLGMTDCYVYTMERQIPDMADGGKMDVW